MAAKKIKVEVISTMAILHNGKRYVKGDILEVTPKEFEDLGLYVKAVVETANTDTAPEEKA